MKKITAVFATILCILLMTVPVMAQNKTVTIGEASATKTEVQVSGTTEALAIVVQLRDAADQILAMESFGTVDGKFNAKLTGLNLTAGKTYTIYIADYEGGTWATKEVKYTVAPTPEETTPAPEETTPAPEETTLAPEQTTPAPTPQDVPSGSVDFHTMYLLLIFVSAFVLCSVGLLGLRKKGK